MGTIVVGVDGSEESKEALRFALDEARLRQANLRIVHAWRFYAGGLGGELIWPPSREAEGEIGREQEEWLDGLVRDVVAEAADVEIAQSVVEGVPAPVLLQAAQDAELLVVGSRGHGGFAGLLLGSVSQQCAQHAPCPVVIVRRLAGRT